MSIYDVQVIKVVDLPIEYMEFCSKIDTKKALAQTEGPLDWKEWRIEALSELDPELVYGDLLTGRVRGRYFECRDPWARSGDRVPSAGVSMGVDGQERLQYHSFLTGETMSVFDFLRKHRPEIKSHQDALQFVSRHSGVPLPGRKSRRRN